MQMLLTDLDLWDCVQVVKWQLLLRVRRTMQKPLVTQSTAAWDTWKVCRWRATDAVLSVPQVLFCKIICLGRYGRKVFEPCLFHEPEFEQCQCWIGWWILIIMLAGLPDTPYMLLEWKSSYYENWVHTIEIRLMYEKDSEAFVAIALYVDEFCIFNSKSRDPDIVSKQIENTSKIID